VAGAVEIKAPRVNDCRVDQATGEKAQLLTITELRRHRPQTIK